MTVLTKEERAALNALVIKGQLDTARCIERLLMDGETVLIVQIIGGNPKIEIMPPHHSSPLWRDCGTYRQTQADIAFVTARFNCQIRWTLTRAEAELMRIANISGRPH